MGGTSTISGGKLCLRIDPRVPSSSPRDAAALSAYYRIRLAGLLAAGEHVSEA